MSVVLPTGSIERVSSLSNINEVKIAIQKEAGDLTTYDVMYNMVLIGIYVRPQKTSGGILRPTSNVEEDIWQGKTGVVLKLGRNAFESDDSFDFKNQRCNPGEWVAFKITDGWQLQVGQWPCRLVRDSDIKLKLSDPRVVF